MKKAAAWAACFAWMALIFFMSSMPGDVSGAQSGLITQIVMRIFPPLADGATINAAFLEWLVRKGAHMAEYAVLFLLYQHALRLSGVRRSAAWALMLCAAYAATDELHQCFTPERGPSPVDVMIDTAGAAIACVLHALWRRIARDRGKTQGA